MHVLLERYLIFFIQYTYNCQNITVFKSVYYRPPEGGRLYDMKVVSGYVVLRTYYF